MRGCGHADGCGLEESPTMGLLPKPRVTLTDAEVADVLNSAVAVIDPAEAPAPAEAREIDDDAAEAG